MSHFKTTDTGDVVIDLPTLSRGTYIPPDEIAAAFNLDQSTSNFAFRVMTLCHDIELETLDAGDPMTVRCEDRGVRIMTDEEALDYLTRRYNQCIAGMMRIEQRMRNVPTSDLPIDLARRKERVEYVMSRINGSILNESNKLGVRFTHSALGDKT